MPIGSVGAQLYPGDIAARYRNTARGLGRPMEKRADKTDPNSNRVRASQHPIAASFGAAVLYRASTTGIGFPTPFYLATAPSPLAADRCSMVEGRMPPNAAPPASVLPSSFTRPLRRPGTGPFTPPDHMAPRGAVPLWTRSTTLARLRFLAKAKTPTAGGSARVRGRRAPDRASASCSRRRGSRRCFGHVGRVREDRCRRALGHGGSRPQPTGLDERNGDAGGVRRRRVRTVAWP